MLHPSQPMSHQGKTLILYQLDRPWLPVLTGGGILQKILGL
jgi:hypothetical protein